MDKVIIDGIYPQTNYTTQQFYTKEEYDKLQSENEQLHNDLKECGIKREQYRQTLQEIRCIVDKNISFMDTSSTTKAMIRIQAKINEVIEE